MSRVGVITWDWRGQPSIEDIRALLGALVGDAISAAMPATGSDEYALVLSEEKLDDRQAVEAYVAWLHCDEEPPLTFDWTPVGSSGSSTGATS